MLTAAATGRVTHSHRPCKACTRRRGGPPERDRPPWLKRHPRLTDERRPYCQLEGGGHRCHKGNGLRARADAAQSWHKHGFRRSVAGSITGQERTPNAAEADVLRVILDPMVRASSSASTACSRTRVGQPTIQSSELCRRMSCAAARTRPRCPDRIWWLWAPWARCLSASPSAGTAARSRGRLWRAVPPARPGRS
jgi:hypothetical protein